MSITSFTTRTHRKRHLHRPQHCRTEGPHAGADARAAPPRGICTTAASSSTAAIRRLTFDTGGLETGVHRAQRRGRDRCRGRTYTLAPVRRALRAARQPACAITPGAEGCDLAEVAAPVERAHPVQFIAFGEVQTDSGLHFAAGGPSAKRELNVLIGQERARPAASWRASRSASRATGRPGRRTNTRSWPKRRTSTSTCRRRRSACSSSTRIRASPSSPRSFATATWC